MSALREAPRPPWLRARRVRFCRSPNHRWRTDEALQKGLASLWRCPRCGKGLCTACEGTADPWSVCDRCLDWILDRRWSRRLFLRLIRRWGIRGRRRELIKEYLEDIHFNGLPERPAA